MTGTEPGLFAGLGAAHAARVDNGKVEPAEIA